MKLIKIDLKKNHNKNKKTKTKTKHYGLLLQSTLQ